MSLLYRMGTGNGSGGDLKPYIVQFTCDSGFIGKTVTMEFQGTPHAGEIVENISGTVVLDGTDGKGKLTLYPMHDGLWKYYATSDVSGYHEETITLEKWGNYPVELNDIPKGATVTPTDDVQTWLHCADVFNKSYTTISEVVADTTTLNTLIANENANDYLVRSTTFATDICSNESAMTYIGLNDYCANKLLSDNTWCTAICNSDYFKIVLNKSVPTLTGNTGSDGGEAFTSIVESKSNAYYVFDKNPSTSLGSNSTEIESGNQIKHDFGYKFSSKVLVKCFSHEVEIGNNNAYEYEVYGSDDGNTYNLIDTITLNKELSSDRVPINNTQPYIYWKVRSTKTRGGSYLAYLKEIQFYGREA